MRPLPTCRPPRSGGGCGRANQSPGSCPWRSKHTSGSIASTPDWRRARPPVLSIPRQITCMAKTERKRSATTVGKKRLTADVARAVRAALDKKATDVVVLDLRGTPAFTDFFVLCSGQNVRQVKAIADAVEEAMRAARMRPAHIEGYD